MKISNNENREVFQLSAGHIASDGDGVKLTRFIGSPDINMVDPFLLLDMFGTDKPEDYIGGFPLHPHRGFETVTYLLAGRMRHKDNKGHEGVIEAGDVQWMSAGQGIIHSEMPEQKDGLLQGFQLWINLPSAEKMNLPSYQEFSKNDIPMQRQQAGVSIKVIAGRTDSGTRGPIENITTTPLYLDVELGVNAQFSQHVPSTHAVIIYAISGSLLIGTQKTKLAENKLAVLGEGEQVNVIGTDAQARFLLIAGKRLDEPVARGGPFVMNTKAEILQAFQDYNLGNF